jgi:hypothetical protein
MPIVDRIAILEHSLSQTDSRIRMLLEDKSTAVKELDFEYDYRATVQAYLKELKRKQNKKPNIFVRLFRK